MLVAAGRGGSPYWGLPSVAVGGGWLAVHLPTLPSLRLAACHGFQVVFLGLFSRAHVMSAVEGLSGLPPCWPLLLPMPFAVALPLGLW